jgi:hypothetical protein
VAVNYKDVGSSPALGERKGSLMVELWFSMPSVQVQILLFPQGTRRKESPVLYKKENYFFKLVLV